MKRRTPKPIRDRALAAYLGGESPQEICRRLGLHKNSVNNFRRRRGYVSQTKMREMRLWDRARELAG